jgi:multicomponent K+:H+ antiporter subunit D
VSDPGFHLAVVPVVLPLAAGALALLAGVDRLGLQRAIGILATLAQLAVALMLAVGAADGPPRVYPLGDWPAPFGIVLVVDRLASLMLLLATFLGAVALWHATGGEDARGRHFHALFQFQLMGLAGAFLTGDLFNLFVFFEVLLIASYCLLLHGRGRVRTGAAIHYVVVNLVASALFLVAAALLYAVTGTLNMADLGLRLAQTAPGDAGLARAAGGLLLVVFAIKAAVVPLHFWLPGTYTAASAPVAALFAIMTKVGVYAIVRVSMLVFGPDAGPVADLAQPFLLPAALVTGIVGAVGALAARDFGVLAAYLTLTSIGTLLAGLAGGTAVALAASLYYLAHSTLVGAALFLVAAAVGASRGSVATRLAPAVDTAHPWLLGGFVLVLAAAATGVPPFSGFVGKLLILHSTVAHPSVVAIWSLVLLTGVVTIVACARAGSVLFWNTAPAARARARSPGIAQLGLGPATVLVLATLALVAGAGPAKAWLDATARQLHDRDAYVAATLGPDARTRPSTRPLPPVAPR